MEDISKLLSSLSWWFTAVLMGILTSYLSRFIDPIFKKLFSALSTKFKKADEKANEKAKRINKILEENPHEQIMLSQSAIQWFLYFLLSMVIVVGIYVINTIVKILFPKTQLLLSHAFQIIILISGFYFYHKSLLARMRLSKFSKFSKDIN